jgi:hypothetical protein
MVILKMFLKNMEKYFAWKRNFAKWKKNEKIKIKIPYFVEAYFVSLNNLENK